jgi:hypothetical protein
MLLMPLLLLLMPLMPLLLMPLLLLLMPLMPLPLMPPMLPMFFLIFFSLNSTMATRDDSHLFNNDEFKSKSISKSEVTKHKQQTIFYKFSNMFSNILNLTPINFDEQAVIDGHVTMQKYLGDRTFPIEESDTNTLICNRNTPDIVQSVSCYPDSVIIEIRDAYNLRYPRHFIQNDDSDIKGILAKLKSQIGGREDAYLR